MSRIDTLNNIRNASLFWGLSSDRAEWNKPQPTTATEKLRRMYRDANAVTHLLPYMAAMRGQEQRQ